MRSVGGVADGHKSFRLAPHSPKHASAGGSCVRTVSEIANPVQFRIWGSIIIPLNKGCSPLLNSVLGTPKGDFVGLQPTGRKIDAMAFQLYCIENRRLAEHWEVADFSTLMHQLQSDAL